jgi:hypothetical protein
MNRRIAVAGLAVFAAASLALTACESTGTPVAGSSSGPAGPASPSASASLSPTAALTAALADLKGTGYDFTQTQGVTGAGTTGSGTYDPSTQSATLTQKGVEQGINAEVDATQIGTNLWVKVDLGPLNKQLGLPTSWMTVDTSKITAGNEPFDFTGSDIFDLAGVMTSVSNVQFTDPTTITGTVDLTAATGNNTPDSDSITKDGAAAKTVPFTAKLDDQGRLTSLTVDTTKFDKDIALATTYSNYGSPSPVAAPTGDIVPAPAGAYSFFNGS